MQNVLKVALIASVLLPLALPAYAKEGASQPQDKVIQPQTEIATRVAAQHAGGGSGGRYGVTSVSSGAGGGGYSSGGGGGGSSAIGRIQASQAKNESSWAVAKETFSNAWQDKAESDKKERDRERQRQENNKSEKGFFEKLWDRFRN